VKPERGRKVRWGEVLVSPSLEKANITCPEDLELIAPKSADTFHQTRNSPPYLLVMTFEGVLASFERQGAGSELADFYDESEGESDESGEESEAERSQQLPERRRTFKKMRKKNVKTKAVVFEEAALSQPVWLDHEIGPNRRNVAPPKYCLFLRHGLKSRLRKLRDMYFVVIILQRDCSRSR